MRNIYKSHGYRRFTEDVWKFTLAMFSETPGTYGTFKFQKKVADYDVIR